MFDYTVFRENSPAVFNEVCKIIEAALPDAVKQKLLIDFDGTTIQTFKYQGKDIDIFDDYDVGAVFIQSGIDLSKVKGLFAYTDDFIVNDSIASMVEQQ